VAAHVVGRVVGAIVGLIVGWIHTMETKRKVIVRRWVRQPTI
jgi:tetrahydromethanopterin S-methyltransferase subunit C